MLGLSGNSADLKNSKTPKIKAYCLRYLLHADIIESTMAYFLHQTRKVIAYIF